MVMLNTLINEPLNYSSARLSESELWKRWDSKQTLDPDQLCVVGKCHAGGEVLMGLKSHSLWSVNHGQPEKQSAKSLLLIFLWPRETILGWLLGRCTCIHLRTLHTLNTTVYQYFWGRNELAPPPSGFHYRHVLRYAQPLQRRLLC